MYIPLPVPDRSPVDAPAYMRAIGASMVGLDRGGLLEHLHQRHLLSVPYFDSPSIERARSVAEVVVAKRGADAVTLNTLFCELLRALDFAAELRLATILDQEAIIPPGTHAVLLVRVGEELLLGDAGFGASLLSPVPLRAGFIASARDVEVCIADVTPARALLQWRRGSDWRDLLEVELEEPSDALPTSDKPEQLRAAILTDRGFARLAGRTLSLPAAPPRELDDSRLAWTLEHLFGVETPGAAWGRPG